LGKFLDPQIKKNIQIKLRCDTRFQRALVGSNKDGYFENATACSKRTMKTGVATQLKKV
jgi:hypothetical protein